MNESRHHATPPSTSLDAVFSHPLVADRLRQAAPAAYQAAGGYWRTAMSGRHLDARMRELVLLALHASATSLDETAIRRHVHRAREAGASDAVVLDVLASIVGVSNHALYSAVPLLIEVLRERGQDIPGDAQPSPAIAAIKEDFVRTRGFWNEQRDVLARCMPEYFGALCALSTEPWKSGVLDARERELVYIAIDCSVTHMYGPGLALHIRRALDAGATPQQILEVFQLAALMGMEGFILGAEALCAVPGTSGGGS